MNALLALSVEIQEWRDTINRVQGDRYHAWQSLKEIDRILAESTNNGWPYVDTVQAIRDARKNSLASAENIALGEQFEFNRRKGL